HREIAAIIGHGTPVAGFSVAGTARGSFHVGGGMARAALIVIMALLLGGALLQSDSSWKSEALGDLERWGLDASFPDGSFIGEEGATGYQVAVLIDRMLTAVEERTHCPAPAAGPPDPEFRFADAPQEHWASTAVERVAQLGVREA